MFEFISALLIASFVSPNVIILAFVFYIIHKLIPSFLIGVIFSLVLAACVGPLVVIFGLMMWLLLKLLRSLEVNI